VAALDVAASLEFRSAADAIARLHRVAFSVGNVRVLNLVEDTSTKVRGGALFGDRFRSIASRAEFFGALPHRRGNLVFILGHLEDGALVTRGTNAAEILRIGLGEVEGFVVDEGVDVIVLGCQAGSTAGISGTTVPINTLRALEQLHASMGSTSVGEMLETFAANGHDLALNRSLIDSLTGESVAVLSGTTKLSEGGTVTMTVVARPRGKSSSSEVSSAVTEDEALLTLTGLVVVAGFWYLSLRGEAPPLSAARAAVARCRATVAEGQPGAAVALGDSLLALADQLARWRRPD